jgi:hypothetical protein
MKAMPGVSRDRTRDEQRRQHQDHPESLLPVSCIGIDVAGSFHRLSPPPALTRHTRPPHLCLGKIDTNSRKHHQSLRATALP